MSWKISTSFDSIANFADTDISERKDANTRGAAAGHEEDA